MPRAASSRYGGDFGEPLHDSNFVADGLVFPDRTPSPGLVELKKVFEPVQISIGSAVRIENRFTFRDLAHLRFEWALEDEGVAVAAGTLRVGSLPAGAVAELPLPPDLPPTSGETWLTVRAVLAADEPWGPAGHEVAWAGRAAPPRPPPRSRRRAAADAAAPAAPVPSAPRRRRAARPPPRPPPTPRLPRHHPSPPVATPPARVASSRSATRRSTRAAACSRGSATSRSSGRGSTSGARRPTTTRATTGRSSSPRCGASTAWTGCVTALSR